ncbi:MAG: hypothetical protein JWR80_9491 [Bradyrhizobium sp.]|nr:hypothetical protein [Bradyrhizobium sp.]
MARLLDRLTSGNSTGIAFIRLWDRVCTQIEAAFGDLSDQVAAIAAAQAAAAAAQTTANTGVANAATAQTTANTGVTNAATADTKAQARMDDLPPVVLLEDYTGALNPPSQLPFTVSCKRYNNTTDVTASSSWTRTVEKGTVSCTMGAATGVLSVTSVTTDAVIRVESTKDSITLRKKQKIAIAASDPPLVATSGGGASGSGGTTATVSTFSSFNTATAAAVTAEMSVTVGSAGQVDLSAPLGVTTDAGTPAGSFPVKGQWYRWNGAAYAAVGSEITSSPSCIVSGSGGVFDVDAGQLIVANSITGLVPAATEKFKFYARNSSGTRTMYLSGTASAVGS